MNISLMLECAVLVFLYMNSMFLIALRLRNNSIVDVGWGFGFVLISVWAFIQSEQTVFQWILLLLVILWGVRLAWYIYSRNKGKGEDYRYAAWRKEWG
jgi:steroid 5-alpha reductase family enzyme